MHGRNASINTSNFLYAASIGATSKVPDWGQLEVQFLGRGNNASHQAGEVDVYETVAAVSRRFKVDSTRLVLRGFSLGGAGAWHVALHNPSMWVAADIGAGTWPRHYLMKDQYPPYQAKVINIWENMTEWALNGFNLPLVGHSGDADNQIPSIPGPEGYPNVPKTGAAITGLDRLPDGVYAFHAATRRGADGGFVTAGGRVIHIVAGGATVDEARDRAYQGAERVEFEGKFYRSDIAQGEVAVF